MQVDVAVVKFTPLVQPIINVHYNTLEMIVKAVFQYRRKMIIKGIRLLNVVRGNPSTPEITYAQCWHCKA